MHPATLEVEAVKKDGGSVKVLWPGDPGLDPETLNCEAKELLCKNFSRAMKLASAAYKVSLQSGYVKGMIESSCIMSFIQINTNQYSQAFSTLSAAEQLASSNTAERSLVYSAKGNCWYYHGVYDSAKYYHEKAVAIFSSQNKKELLARECNLLGKVYIKLGNQKKALQYHGQAMKIFNTARDMEGLAWAQDLLGEVFYAQRLFDKALSVWSQSYNGFKSLDHKLGMASTQLHRGNAYYLLMRDDSAEICYNLSLLNFIELGDNQGAAICYSNLSRVFLELGKPGRALDYANKSLAAIRPGNYATVEAGTFQQLGDIYGELKDYDKAVSYIKKALTAALKADQKVMVRDCYKSLSEIYEVMQKPDLAMKNLLLAYRYKDTVQPILFNRQLAEMQVKYETEMKETEIRMLKQQEQISRMVQKEQEATLQKQRYLLAFSVTLTALILLTGYYYFSRQKLLANVKSEKLRQETEELERQRIAKDIHDELGSGLSKIKFLSELAASKTRDIKELQPSLNTISDISKELVDNMRELIWAMDPENTTLANLVYRIREYSSDYLEDYPAEVKLHFPDTVPDTPISKECHRQVFMTVKESLNNIFKHSKASSITITAFIDHEALCISIKDNGIGFSDTQNPKGNGLRNMKNRIESLKGSFNSKNGAASGAEITILVPVGKR